MIELNELDKEFIDLCVKDVDDEEKRARLIDMHLDYIKEWGNIQEKAINERGFPVFVFKNGCRTTIAPRRYKFNGPLIPAKDG
jgi:hypothetical protein